MYVSSIKYRTLLIDYSYNLYIIIKFMLPNNNEPQDHHEQPQQRDIYNLNNITIDHQNQIDTFKVYQPLSNGIDINRLRQSANTQFKKYKQSSYYGEFQDGKRSGFGIMIYNNGRVYEGQWKNDTKEGQGFQQFANKCVYQGIYRNGKPNGQGRYVWINGQSYEGEWKQGLKHGSGIWKGINGDCYIGQWKEGKAEGTGVQNWANGDCYQGQFKQCLKHGEGIQKFANGDIYKGRYVNGRPEGYGQYFWENGSYFKGEFKNGLRNGKGFWKKAAGVSDKFEGEYCNDKKSGKGVFTWSTGNVYKGHYDGDLRNGYGQMYWKDGTIYKGQWWQGVQHGQGQIFVPEEGVKRGIFENNVLIAVSQDSYSQIFDNKKNRSYLRNQDKDQDQREREPELVPKNASIFRSRPYSTYKKLTQNKSSVGKDSARQLSGEGKPTSKSNIPSRFIRNNAHSSKHQTLEPKKERILHSAFYLHKIHKGHIVKNAISQTIGNSAHEKWNEPQNIPRSRIRSVHVTRILQQK